jgi:hypothetical protein
MVRRKGELSSAGNLAIQLKAANDNTARLEERVEWLERKWSRPEKMGTN